MHVVAPCQPAGSISCVDRKRRLIRRSAHGLYLNIPYEIVEMPFNHPFIHPYYHKSLHKTLDCAFMLSVSPVIFIVGLFATFYDNNIIRMNERFVSTPRAELGPMLGQSMADIVPMF